MSLRIVAILCLLEVCRAYTPAANPPMMTHASMDVGNIISIVIPESPDENINVDQLTGEFRQQLERIKKQSRASKVEHGLVTLKRVLPEMSREEKRKTLPLIRRVLHSRRVANSGPTRNWTREGSRVDRAREVGQLVRSRSDNPEDRRIFRNYEEPENREVVAARIDQSVGDKDDYRRISEEPYANHREGAPREDAIPQSDQIRQQEFHNREGPDRREDRIIFQEEDPPSLKIGRSGPAQEWNNQQWDDQSRDNSRIYQETSTTDWNSKSERAVRQKDPGNDIFQNDGYGNLARHPELRATASEDPNADCSKTDQQISSRYPFSRQHSPDSSKRSVNNARGFGLADVQGLVNYPRGYDIKGPLNPDCDVVRRNGSGHSLKDEDNKDMFFDKQHQQVVNFESNGQRASQRIIQEQSERSNTSGFENIVGESVDDYATKKKKGHRYSEVFRRLPSIKSGLGNRIDRWNIPAYDDQRFNNSSDDVKAPPSVYEMFGEKDVNPSSAFLDNEAKMSSPQQFANYGGDNPFLRIQRATNETHYNIETPKLPSNVSQRSREDYGSQMKGNIFDRLKHLFKSPPFTNIIHTSVVLLYVNQSEAQGEKAHEAMTDARKSQSTMSPLIPEQTSSADKKLR